MILVEKKPDLFIKISCIGAFLQSYEPRRKGCFTANDQLISCSSSYKTSQNRLYFRERSLEYSRVF